ncbi:MAG: NUDIX domain-containing protein [Pseudomonadota bacterium]
MRLPKPLARRAFIAFGMATRAMTLGVRALVLNEEGHVFLVRHTYVEGWHFPGGGVERDETMQEALEKELREEGNILLTEEPYLFHFYRNTLHSRYDHVALFVCRGAVQSAPKSLDHEIAEARFFPTDALPEGATPSTRQRLREVLEGAGRADLW